MAVVLITGASGLLGRSVTRNLQARGHVVKSLTTRQVNKDATQNAYLWNISSEYIEQNALDEVECVIHLAGASIGTARWTSANRRNIIESRVSSAALLLKTLEQRGQKIDHFISASGTGFYPDPSHEILGEDHAPGVGFPAEICLKWEAAATAMASYSNLVSVFRFGPVLSLEGGLLEVVTKTLPVRILPILGSPGNMLSWIHIQDAADMICFALENKLGGTFNATAPKPATQKEFTKAIAGNKLCYFPIVPAFLLKLFLGDRAALPLSNQIVSSEKIQEQGFQFRFPDIPKAIQHLMHVTK